MTSLAVSDIISTNLLSELNLNPVWEKWRGYFFTGSIVCSLFPFYMTLNGVPLHCVPQHTAVDLRPTSITDSNNVSISLPQWNIMNGTSQNGGSVQVTLLTLYLNTLLKKKLAKKIDNDELSVPETAYVNSQCASQYHLQLQRYSGSIMLGIVVVILFMSSFWLHIESVKDGINTFSEAREKLNKIVLSQEEMKRMCLQRIKVSESNTAPKKDDNNDDKPLPAIRAVREVVRLFAHHGEKSTIFTWYRRRCIVMSIGIWIILVVLIIMTSSVDWNNTSTCIIKERESVNSSNEFRCAVHCANTILVFIIIFCVTLGLQTFVFFAPYWKWKQLEKMSEHIMHPENLSVRLMIMFWESASPVQSGLFSKMVRYVNSTDFKDELATNMKDIIDDEDYELIRIKVKLFGNTPEIIGLVYENIDCDPNTRKIDLKRMIEAMKAGQCPLTNAEIRHTVKEIIRKMNANNRVSNELIVNMLRSCNPNKIQDVVCDIDLTRTENESLHSNQRRSVLFYAFLKEHSKGPDPFIVARALCKREKRQDLKVTKKENEEPVYHKMLEEFLLDIYPREEVGEILGDCTALIRARSDGEEEEQQPFNT